MKLIQLQVIQILYISISLDNWNSSFKYKVSVGKKMKEGRKKEKKKSVKWKKNRKPIFFF